MNRLLRIVFLLLLAPELAFCQSLCSQVFGSAANTLPPIGGFQISFMVGEPISTTLASGNYTLTQGFHQPENCVVTSVNNNLSLALPQLRVFPVPATETLRIDWATPLLESANMYTYNTIGQLLDLRPISAGTDKTQFDLLNWPTGTFHTQIRGQQGQVLADFKFIKL
jgi:hypothetical protein